jgi:phage tail sheath protein FI
MAEKIISPNVFINESDKSLVSRGPVTTGAAIVGPTVKGRPLVPTVVTSYSEYVSVFGEQIKSGSQYYEYLTSLTAKEYFSGGGSSLLVTRIISGSAYNTYAQAYVNVSGSTTSSLSNASFTLEVKNYGTEANNTSSISAAGALDSGSASNVRWEVTDTDSTKGTFTLVVRSGDDTTSNKNILETWANLSLDPQQANFISRQIGDEKEVYVAAVGTEAAYVQITGSFAGGSRYIRVATVSTLHIDSFNNDGVFKSAAYSGSLPAIGSGSFGGTFDGGVAATNLGGATFFDAITPSATNTQGFINTDYTRALALLSNKDEYDFNLLLTPGLFLGANAAISDAGVISTAESRGDAFAIADLVAYGDNKSNAISAAAGSASNYGAGYWPWVQTFSANLGRPVWVPPSVVMAGVYAFNDAVGAEWFAPAGLNRGGIGSVIRAEKRLSADDRDTLYAANVNPLATFPGEGVVAFGQKTFQKRATSLDRINVRRLLINLKRYVSSVSRQLVFEQNSTITRNRFLSVVNPYMEQVVSRQGLFAYKVIMDETNNTADVIDRNQLIGQIYVQPTKTAEFIILDFTLQPTGATFPV